MHNTMIYGNSADQRGIICVYTYHYVRYRTFTLILNFQLEIHNTTIYGNRAGQGGAVSIYNDHHYYYNYGNVSFQLIIHNTTAHSNRANQGGAVYIYSSGGQGTFIMKYTMQFFTIMMQIKEGSIHIQ